ncbi:MAG: nucleotidyltransferase family protein [Chloroflexi bacterium]|nr:nucleotidyltransferase family protein [Chloroflexota bacterium]
MPGVSAVLTAAGESARMGQPKPLLSWRGVTLLEYQFSSLSAAGVSEIIVVLGHRAESVARYVTDPSARYVVNEAYRQGRTTSIKTGLEQVDPSSESILLLGVDQPRTPEIISKVLRAHAEQDSLITSPRYLGRGGHPLVFSSSLTEELCSITEEGQGVRAVFQAHRDEVTEVEIDDPMVRLDLNTLDDYQEAKAFYGA